MSKVKFTRLFPNAFYLDADDLDSLTDYLRHNEQLSPESTILSVESAGDGNMNLTRRINIANQSSFIIKQSRPWVEKYPDIPAPRNRLLIEAEYLRLVNNNPLLQAMSPVVTFLDEASCLMIMEDLGHATDFGSVYADSQFELAALSQCLDYIEELHNYSRDLDLAPLFQNREMRNLNHFHIFDFPLQKQNGFDLDTVTPGLEAVANNFRDALDTCTRIRELGKRYLADGSVLVHGDFYPASFLKADKGLTVIDAEFCFQGFAEFDYSVLLAHLVLANAAQCTQDMVLRRASDAKLETTVVKEYAAVEIMRRLIGVAQLPLKASLEEKQEKLQLSKKWLRCA